MNTPSYPSSQFSRRGFLGLAGLSVGAVALGACGTDSNPGGGGGNTNPTGPQTIDWWHIQNTEPMLPVWDAMAKEYQASHSNVTVAITPIENEAFKARLTTVTQAGTPPDLFQSWGGGVLKQQVDAGLVKDITADVQPWIGNLLQPALTPYTIDGKIYGIPFDVGMVGFWYNKKLFTQAGITTPPATWAELLTAVGKLKTAGITPIALAGEAKWPGHFYWSYLCMRVAGLNALNEAAASKNFENPDFVTAGTRLKELVDLQPFQKGFQAAKYDTPDGQAATVGGGKAAMELMGQWAPAVQEAQSGKKLGADLGFFPFPAVDGGKGKVTDVFGGGNGFAIGKDAPPATVDFLKFLLEVANQRKSTATGAVIPTVKGAEDAIKDPNAQQVSKAFRESTGFQLYLDQAYAPSVGAQVNDSVAALIAGKGTPEDVTKQITEAAKRA